MKKKKGTKSERVQKFLSIFTRLTQVNTRKIKKCLAGSIFGAIIYVWLYYCLFPKVCLFQTREGPRGADYADHITAPPPGFSDLPTALLSSNFVTS